MIILSGTFLVLLSWMAMLGVATGVGLLPALLLRGGRWRPGTAREALWWGLAFLAALITSVSLILPLRAGKAGAAILGVSVVLALCGAVIAVSAYRRRTYARRAAPRWSWAVMLAVGVAVVYLAVAALGPVTNYDTGLYHLGAIAYAGDYRAIPGLANLYFPLGYANAQFPVAAFLGNGPWDGVGYRLLNGALFAAMALDLAFRVRRARLTPGLFVMAVGVTAAFVPMVALSDYWVTSPTSDSAVLVLSLVSSAYLADAVSKRARARAAGSVAVVTAVLAVTLRPTMAVFAGASVVVLVVTAWRAHRRGARAGAGWLLPVAFAALAAIVMTARDVILSGWLQYPLSVVPFDVPWRAADPTQFRVPTLGAARDPEDLWTAAEGWGWVSGWFTRLPAQWETYEATTLILVAALLVILAARTRAGLRWRGLLLALAPSALAVVFWWVATPPSFRFIWGPLFALGAVPAGWALWRLTRPGTIADPARMRVLWLTALGVAIPVVAVTLFSGVARFDPSGLTEQRTWALGVRIPYAVAPVVTVPVESSTLSSGLTVLLPTQSDQCWTNYPLCTAQTVDSVSLRGSGIQEGFLP